MSTWINNRLPVLDDADLQGMVRWGKNHPGMLMDWRGVRLGEYWSHSSAWAEKPKCYDDTATCE